MEPTNTASSADENGDSLVTAGERESGWEFELAGSGAEACGIEITQVDKNDHGEWEYKVTGDDSGTIIFNVQGKKELRVC